ncbi:30S ribosomal protein S8 [Candidatus Peregrinibacteria bacterium]|nr:30S ribosomal protein S8 [Candidatus Peregrinibacteria bacterium]
MLTDPIADFLNRLKNASRARKKECATRSSKMLKSIAQVLLARRFIKHFEEVSAGKSGNVKELHIELVPEREPLEIKRVSKPGQRIYVGCGEVKSVRSGLGLGIISTSRGVLSDAEARKLKVGGEYICEIY